MKHIILFAAMILMALTGIAQEEGITAGNEGDNAELQKPAVNRLSLGGYGEVHFNQELSSDTRHNGEMDVHRLVLLMEYNFNSKTRFVSEIEYEHVSDVYVEQAYLQYKINNFFNLRGGLLLIPMGIINEYHEPTSFFGVERPFTDQKLTPTTWREVGLGFAGTVMPASLRYQAYLVNGFNGFDGKARFNGQNGLRGGRQKGGESYISSPDFTARLEFFGLRGLTSGLSVYFGNSESTLYGDIDRNDAAAVSKADSSVVGISMVGFDTRYSVKGFMLRGQVYFSAISNTGQYNRYTSVAGKDNDLGSSMFGYYIETAYNVLKSFDNVKTELLPFARFEFYDTHYTVSGEIPDNDLYRNRIITGGVSLKLVPGAVFKVDVQFMKTAADIKYSTVLNAGFGVMF